MTHLDRSAWLKRLASLPGALAVALAPGIVFAEVPSPFNPASPQAASIAQLFWIIIVIAVIIFVGVEGVIIYSAFAFRASRHPRAAQFSGSPRIEIIWTAIPALLLVVVLYLTIRTMAAAYPFTTASDPIEITALGHQWWWEFDYPNEKVVAVGEFHVPVGEPVIVHLKSDNVIHSFWIPEMNGKLDLVPGQDRTWWFTPTKTGVFDGLCAEFCGVEHAWMRMRLVVQSRVDYDAWIRAQQAVPPEPTGLAAQGKQIFFQQTCPSCHVIAGTSANGVAGPDLTHVASRSILAGGVLENNPTNMARWLADPQTVKPGNLMPDFHLTPAEVQALTAYMETLR